MKRTIMIGFVLTILLAIVDYFYDYDLTSYFIGVLTLTSYIILDELFESIEFKNKKK